MTTGEPPVQQTRPRPPVAIGSVRHTCAWNATVASPAWWWTAVRGPETREGYQAFVERRTPKWTLAAEDVPLPGWAESDADSAGRP
jgi:hypothetical protein